MQARILYMERARPGGWAHWVRVALACLAAAAAGVGVIRFIDPPRGPTRPVVIPAAPAAPVASKRATATSPATATTPADAVATPANCPLQSMTLARDGVPPQTICMDATRVQQSGSVRSYVVQPGDAQGWTLQLDLVERRLLSASLKARDGREHACPSGQCQGSVELVRSGAAQRLSVRGLRLPTGDSGTVVISAELRVPSDEQVPGLACVGPRVSIAAPDGTAEKFCGLGGAGVEIADDGRRHYRFQDHEGRTLTVSVNGEQQVVAIDFAPFGCRTPHCRGASTSSAEPDNPLAERSFFFGRTALSEGSATESRGPGGVVLDGSLVMPSQQ